MRLIKRKGFSVEQKIKRNIKLKFADIFLGIEIGKRYEKLKFFEDKPMQYELIGTGNMAVRLVDEYIYKLQFIIDEESQMGYELFKCEHKNQLLNSLLIAFRKMICMLIE